MKNFPLVSIITPSYNSALFLKETIESIRKQDYPIVEHIIVDGGSNDGTIDILRQCENLKWISEADQGQSDALNKGFKMANGEIIGWLNADDIYTPDAISTAAHFLIENQDFAMVYGDMNLVDEEGEFISLRKSKRFNLSTLFLENFINQPTVFMRKSVIEQLGGLDESLHYAMDRDLWLRAGSRYKMQYLPGWVGANFRLHTGAKTHNNKPGFHEEHIRIMEQSISNPLYKNIPLKLKCRAIQQAQVRLLFTLMEQSISKHDVGTFLKEFFLLIIGHWRYILEYPFRKFA
jgi:glycosyltransferase involved in cell wall biosynthesis